MAAAGWVGGGGGYLGGWRGWWWGGGVCFWSNNGKHSLGLRLSVHQLGGPSFVSTG